MYVTLPESFAGIVIAPGGAIETVERPGIRTHRRTKPGQSLFMEGDEARFLFEVVTGVVRLSRVSRGGRRQVISFGFPGDVLGFPLNGSHHADCDVLEGGDVLVYPARALAAPDDDPDLHRYLVRAAMLEIGGMQDHFMVLGRKCAIEKTAAFLGVLACRIGEPTPTGTSIHLPMYRSDIADFLGLSSETISRAFTLLRQRGIIELPTSKEIVVPDVPALLRLVEAE